MRDLNDMHYLDIVIKETLRYQDHKHFCAIKGLFTNDVRCF